MTKIVENMFNKIPNGMTVKNEKNLRRLDWIGKEITSPQNRLIMGVTALATQPFIDLKNDKVDEKTRVMSCAKTLAKILVGTTVGVIVRHSAIKLAKQGCKDPAKGLGKWASVFIPEGVNFQKEADFIAQHKNTIGTVIGTLTGIVTNFIIDMPLTKILTSVFIKKFEGKPEKQTSEGGKE